ncbi:tetratricopeptide repeat protein [Marinobacter sp. GN3S48]|uniref:tetratricopeptide repeat protein n=1 Tax=Marinobacter sp. GN3S48 TaxID=3382302 RepID=UPI00387B5D52
MQVFLHIGAPKTGTSAIQYFMNSNRELLERLGFYYPEHGSDQNNVSGGHVAVGVPLIEKDMDKAKNQVEQWVKAARSEGCALVLSAESFYGKFAELKELFSGHDVEIISYFRDPMESVVSNHNQVVKRHFATTSLQDYLASHIGRDAAGLSGLVMLKWISAFGRDRVHVYPYHSEAFPEGRIEYSFLSILGIHRCHWNAFELEARRVNTSYTGEALELKRLLNHVLKPEYGRVNFEIDWALQRFSDERNNAGAKKAIPFVSGDVWRTLAGQFEQSNAIMLDEVLDLNLNGFLASPAGGYLSDLVEPDGGERLQGVVGVWRYLREQLSEISTNLEVDVAEKVKQERAPYALFRLADIMGIPYREPATDFGIPPAALKVFLQDKSGTPDFLREIAKILAKQGQYEDALPVIKRALELRPTGPAIKRLHDEIATRVEIGS